MAPIAHADRITIARAGLRAAGVAPDVIPALVALCLQIVDYESHWDPDTHTLDDRGKGPPRFFGTGPAHMPLPGEISYRAPHGVAQLTPWLFERYHAAGTSADINDPVASIAALWRFIADEFAVDIKTGNGVRPFREAWWEHRNEWWWLADVAPFGRPSPHAAPGSTSCIPASPEPNAIRPSRAS